MPAFEPFNLLTNCSFSGNFPFVSCAQSAERREEDKFDGGSPHRHPTDVCSSIITPQNESVFRHFDDRADTRPACSWHLHVLNTPQSVAFSARVPSGNTRALACTLTCPDVTFSESRPQAGFLRSPELSGLSASSPIHIFPSTLFRLTLVWGVTTRRVAEARPSTAGYGPTHLHCLGACQLAHVRSSFAPLHAR